MEGKVNTALEEAVFVRFYNFESDDESHINGDELSELSDTIAENEEISLKAKDISHCKKETESVPNEVEPDETMLSLDDIPYDRDLKWINVPNGARPKPTLATGNRLFQQVKQITGAHAKELQKLDDHYKLMDQRKIQHDARYNSNRKDFGEGRTLFEVDMSDRQRVTGRGRGDERTKLSHGRGTEGRANRTSGSRKPTARPTIHPQNASYRRLGAEKTPTVLTSSESNIKETAPHHPHRLHEHANYQYEAKEKIHGKDSGASEEGTFGGRRAHRGGDWRGGRGGRRNERSERQPQKEKHIPKSPSSHDHMDASPTVLSSATGLNPTAQEFTPSYALGSIATPIKLNPDASEFKSQMFMHNPHGT